MDGLVVVNSFCGWAGAVLELLLKDTGGSRENVGEGASRKWMPCKPPMTLAPQTFYSSIGNGKGREGKGRKEAKKKMQ